LSRLGRECGDGVSGWKSTGCSVGMEDGVCRREAGGAVTEIGGGVDGNVWVVECGSPRKWGGSVIVIGSVVGRAMSRRLRERECYRSGFVRVSEMCGGAWKGRGLVTGGKGSEIMLIVEGHGIRGPKMVFTRVDMRAGVGRNVGKV
jgi:hypothetical protein